MKERPKVSLNVYLILQNQEGILLSLRENTGYEDGRWGLVSGHCESQESAKTALCREAKEEIGIDILPEDLAVVHVLHRLTDRENIDIFMECAKWQGEITNCEPHKCGDLQFFNLTCFPKNTIGYIEKALECIFVNDIYSEAGWENAC